MARPKKYTERRITTAVRMPEWLHGWLHETADKRGTSVNHLMVLAAKDYLERLPAIEPDREREAAI